MSSRVAGPRWREVRRSARGATVAASAKAQQLLRLFLGRDRTAKRPGHVACHLDQSGVRRRMDALLDVRDILEPGPDARRTPEQRESEHAPVMAPDAGDGPE